MVRLSILPNHIIGVIGENNSGRTVALLYNSIKSVKTKTMVKTKKGELMETTITNGAECLEAILEKHGVYLYEEGTTPQEKYRWLQIAVIANKIERKQDFKYCFQDLYSSCTSCDEFQTCLNILESSYPLNFGYFANLEMIEYLIDFISDFIESGESLDDEAFLFFCETLKTLKNELPELKGYESRNFEK